MFRPTFPTLPERESDEDIRRLIEKYGEPEPMDWEDYPREWYEKYYPYLLSMSPFSQPFVTSGRTVCANQTLSEFGVTRTSPEFGSPPAQAVDPIGIAFGVRMTPLKRKCICLTSGQTGAETNNHFLSGPPMAEQQSSHTSAIPTPGPFSTFGPTTTKLKIIDHVL